MLTGGLIAQGVRPIQSREDYLYDRAGNYYWWFTTFPGWRKSDVDDLPPWLAERLPFVHEIVKAIEDKKAAAKEKAAQEANGQRR